MIILIPSLNVLGGACWLGYGVQALSLAFQGPTPSSSISGHRAPGDHEVCPVQISGMNINDHACASMPQGLGHRVSCLSGMPSLLPQHGRLLLIFQSSPLGFDLLCILAWFLPGRVSVWVLLSRGSGTLVSVTRYSNGCSLACPFSIWPCVVSVPPQHTLVTFSYPTPQLQHSNTQCSLMAWLVP